eukprot:m.56864 g.56864  ORF g.56864 m.56864 type:complete len:174 (-) comp15751_c0_seq1:41-562(-)
MRRLVCAQVLLAAALCEATAGNQPQCEHAAQAHVALDDEGRLVLADCHNTTTLGDVLRRLESLQANVTALRQENAELREIITNGSALVTYLGNPSNWIVSVHSTGYRSGGHPPGSLFPIGEKIFCSLATVDFGGGSGGCVVERNPGGSNNWRIRTGVSGTWACFAVCLALSTS